MEINPRTKDFKHPELLNDLEMILGVFAKEEIEYHVFIREEKKDNETGYLGFNHMKTEHAVELVIAFLAWIDKEIISNKCTCVACRVLKEKVKQVLGGYVNGL